MAAKRAGSSKILIFTAPPFCPLQTNNKKARLEDKEAVVPVQKWHRTDFRFDGTKFIVDAPLQGLEIQDIDSKETEESSLFLEYDPQQVQESVLCYLDSEFADNNIIDVNENKQSDFPLDVELGVTHFDKDDNLQKEYEHIQAASQMLLSEGGIDSNSSVGENEQEKRLALAKGKLSLFSQFQNTHQLTQEDVYTQPCSAEASNLTFENGRVCGNNAAGLTTKPNATVTSSSSSSSGIPTTKSSLTSLKTASTISDQSYFCSDKPASHATTSSSHNAQTSSSSAQTSLSSSSSPSSFKLQTKSATDDSSDNVSPTTILHRNINLPQISDKLHCLRDCNAERNLANMVCIVLQINPIKEIKIKSGLKAGQYIPLSSIVVADETKSSFKLTLWREASKWTEKIQAGDCVVVTSVRIEKWRNECIGQTTYRSSLYNLHKPVKPLSADWLLLVSQERLDQLMSWANKSHGYLFSKSQSGKAKVQYTAVPDLKDNTLVHIRGRLDAVNVLVGKQKGYSFGHQRLPKIAAVLTCAQNQTINLYLWGQQAKWLSEMRHGIGVVWELEYLTAKCDMSSDSIILHSNPKSTKTRLPHGHDGAHLLLASLEKKNVASEQFISIKKLLDAKFQGTADVDGFIMAILFNCNNGDVLRVENESDIDNLLSNSHNLTYVGCKTCEFPLEIDRNGIYGQCSHCLHNVVNYNYTISHYFRPINVIIGDSKGSVNVIVPKNCASKLLHFEAQDLLRVNHEMVKMKFVNNVKELLLSKRKIQFSLFCEMSLDDNDFVICRNFTLVNYTK